MEYKFQAVRASVVDKSDSAELIDPTGANNLRGCLLYIGTGGNLKVKTTSGDVVTFVNVNSGSFLPVNVRQVYLTGTTATDILALW